MTTHASTHATMSKTTHMHYTIAPSLSRVLTRAATPLLLALGLSVAPVTALQADTYMWVDDKGVVNYAERKPRNVPEDRIRLVSDRATRPSSSPAQTLAFQPSSPSPSSPSATNSDANDNLDEDQRAMLRDLQAAEAERQAQVAKIREENCSRSRRVLNNLQTSGRLRVVGEDGGKRVMTESERSERIAAAQEGIAANCES